MRSSIHIVDVDRLETWSRYRPGLCDRCAANCCTMPLEVKLPDLVRLGLVDPFEAEHEAPQQIAKRLTKVGAIERFNIKHGLFTMPPGQRRLPLPGRAHPALHGVRTAPGHHRLPIERLRPAKAHRG